jgi:small subunit ribosomal protein S1
MSNPSIPESEAGAEPNESFADILSLYEKSHSHKAADGSRRLEGTVISVTSESVFLDIGYKTEGILPLAVFQSAGETVTAGDKVAVAVKGRDPEGYYELTRFKVEQPKDWSALERAFAEKATIMGTVTAVIKGGLSVDVGVRAFMPASRSGTSDAVELEKLVGQEVRCRITKLDVTEEDVVVDRRAVSEEEERATKERRYSEIREGDTVSGTIRSFAEYGAFVDIGEVDALLHISDIAWGRVGKPADVLALGQQIEVKVLKVDPEKRRISVGLKQLQPDPWASAAQNYKVGERVRGSVTRLAEFGAFVELEPGLEGLIHLSEMSWNRRARKAGDVVKPGENVEVVVLGVSSPERRISLGLKQALGDPWGEVAQKFAAGTVIEGPVTSITKFGAFVQLSEGVEGMVHVSEISAGKPIEHPQDVLKVGQTVKAQVMAVDTERRLLRLSIKQMVPTSLDEYLAEHNEGDVVTGRVVDSGGERSRVELGEGILAVCQTAPQIKAQQAASGEAKADLSSLSSMLQARWKGSASAESRPEAVRAGQVRKFRIAKVDRATKKIELELA